MTFSTVAGGNDVLRSGAGDDQLSVTDDLFNKIDGGGGNDTLIVDDFDLDLTNISNLIIESVEALDITGTGDNTLTLSLEDVFDLSETGNIDLSGIANSVNNLVIHGDNGRHGQPGRPDAGHPAEAGSWTDTATTTTIGSDTYRVIDFVSGGDVLASVWRSMTM